MEQKAAQEEQVKQTIRTGIETGAERLQADLEKEFSAKNADHAEIIAKYSVAQGGVIRREDDLEGYGAPHKHLLKKTARRQALHCPFWIGGHALT